VKKAFFLSALVLSLCLSFVASAQTLNLVTTEWETFTSDGSHSARLNQFVEQAFERAGYQVRITIERPAFAGSGLNTGRYDGQIDFIDLNPEQSQFSYSQQYFPLNLHLISKNADIEDVRTFSQIRNARVAVENRYASSPTLRLVSEVKWSRNPSTFESIANLADERSNYLLSDSLMFAEFNRLLSAENEEVVHKSQEPLFKTGLQVSLNNRLENANNILAAFDQAARAMLQEGSVNSIFGIEWILADIDQDGVADFITSSEVQHTAQFPSFQSLTDSAYSWDDTKPADASQIIVDGQTLPDWEAVKEAIVQASDAPNAQRSSFLDANAYKNILRKW
jgi:ABC-type amino acid transport substrate-binding protein